MAIPYRFSEMWTGVVLSGWETYVLVQGQLTNGDQGVVGMGPDLGHVENVPAVALRVLGLHDLEVNRPGGEVALGNSIVEVGGVVVRTFAGELDGLVLG